MATRSEGTPRSERASGKGRRRRAAAEQRRIEQQRWGQYDEDRDEPTELILAPSSRRRRRPPRRNIVLREDLEADFVDDELGYDYTDESTLDIALALSLSLSDTPTNTTEPVTVPLDMSYESLVQLEDVPCVASSALVASLTRNIFEKHEGSSSECCVICQNEYVEGDKLACLPCKHDVHDACGSEWLLKYSKLCPVCKLDVTEHH